MGFSGRPWCWCSCRGTSVWLNSEPASRCGRGPASPRGRIRGPPGLRLAAAARGGSLPARSCACLSSRRTRVSSAATLGMKLWTQMTSCSWPAQTEARRGSQRMRNEVRAPCWESSEAACITRGAHELARCRVPEDHIRTQRWRARAKSTLSNQGRSSRCFASESQKSTLSNQGRNNAKNRRCGAEHAPQDRHTV